MSKINLTFIFRKAVGKAVTIHAVKPMPINKIITHGRSEIAESVRLKFKFYDLIFRALHAKCPVKPILTAVTNLIFKYCNIVFYFFYCYITADKILMNNHYFLPYLINCIEAFLPRCFFVQTNCPGSFSFSFLGNVESYSSNSSGLSKPTKYPFGVEYSPVISFKYPSSNSFNKKNDESSPSGRP